MYIQFTELYTVLFSLIADQNLRVELRCSFTQHGTVMTVATMTVGRQCCTINAWFYCIPLPNDKMRFRLHTHPEWRLCQVAHVSYHHRSHRHEGSWSIQVSWPSSPALLSQLLDKTQPEQALVLMLAAAWQPDIIAAAPAEPVAGWLCWVEPPAAGDILETHLPNTWSSNIIVFCMANKARQWLLFLLYNCLVLSLNK